MSNYKGSLLLLAAVALAPLGVAAGQGEVCIGAGGSFFDDVTVPAGATCDLGIGGDVIFGDVTLEPGASLFKTTGRVWILGDLRGSDIASLRIGGCSVMGDIDIDTASGDVQIGACSVQASVNVQGVAGQLTIRNNEIGHRLRVNGNVGAPGTSMDIAGNFVAGDIVINDNEHTRAANVDANKLGGRLTCRDNVPTPSSEGTDGTLAFKGQEGQCATLP